MIERKPVLALVGGDHRSVPSVSWLRSSRCPDKTVIEAQEGRSSLPLELAGFNIYIREGAITAIASRSARCDEVARYGHYSPLPVDV